MPKTKIKRANGEGTFYQKEDKTWVHQVTVGRKPDGRPDRKTFTGKTRTACIERREAYEAEKTRVEVQAQAEEALRLEQLAEIQRKGRSFESEIPFNEAFLNWLKLYKSPPTKKATTYSGYLDIYEDHFEAFFGELALYEITPDVVQEYYNKKQEHGSRRDGLRGGLSPKTIRNHHMLLKDFFEYAVTKYKLSENPALKTERPAVVIPQMRVLDPDEMLVFMQEVARETQRVAILFDLFMGLRVGELLAAEVSDIKVKEQAIEVKRNITRVKTDSIDPKNPNIKIIGYNPEKKTHLVVQDTPKTKNSHRNVPIGDDLFLLLSKHLFFLDQSGWPNPYNLLFPSTTGGYIDPKSFEIRLKAVSERCGIPKVGPHALRHTFATRMIEGDVQLTTLMNLLGHASVATTQRYVTTLPEEKRKAVESMADYWNPEHLIQVRRLNGAKNRMRFEDVELPSWLQDAPVRGPRKSQA